MIRKPLCFMVIAIFWAVATTAHAGFFEDFIKSITGSAKSETDEKTVTRGLREALSIGTQNAVNQLSKQDGYFKNEIVKIRMPEKIQTITDVLGKVGLQKQVDEFILSMNRAAEKAAPKAAPFFVEEIKKMSFDDAMNIFKGGDTAATDFFREKASTKIYNTFKPIISLKMEEVGVTRNYKQMIQKYESIPLVKKVSFDIDDYITNKALDGLFQIVAEEEEKIRTDPGARVTELLKTVFGK